MTIALLAKPPLQTRLARAVKKLFASGAPGAWYDPSDMTTLYQDAAGTTPVTAVEQPVGLMKDKSGRGNHAFQTTAASRPVLRARYNLLTKTEQFDDAVWTKNGATITANSVTAPNGTTTADTFTANSTTYPSIFRTETVAAGVSYRFSVCAKSFTGNRLSLEFRGATSSPNALFNLDTGAVVSGSGAITSLGEGWYRCSITVTSVDASELVIVGMGDASPTGSIYIWGSFLVPSNQSTLPYQRVNTSTDYDTVGFKPYLASDGVDDGMVTNSIDFTATDKMTVCAGVRKLSDAATAIAVELSASAASNVGAFFVAAPVSAGATYTLLSQGNALSLATTPSSYASPITNVVTGLANISGDLATLRINGAQVATSSTDQGTGNFGNYPLYLFRRGGTSLPFNGRFYGMTVVGKPVTAGELASLEAYTNSKTGAY